MTTLTLTQLRQLTEQGEALASEIEDIDRRIVAFEKAGPTVRCFACLSPDGSFGRLGPTVEVMPVDTSVAISALKRLRAKALARLAELGVTLEDKS